VHLAFVLTAKAESADPAPVLAELKRSWPPAPTFDDAEVDGPERFSLTGRAGCAVVGAMPGAVPNGEAEAHAPYSAAFLDKEPELPGHAGHLVVAFTPEAGGRGLLGRRRQSEPRQELRAFVRVVAALATTTSASGVYWGAAGATHPTAFFVELARADDSSPFLWSGVSFSSTEEAISAS
jgi:hypothetical protein